MLRAVIWAIAGSSMAIVGSGCSFLFDEKPQACGDCSQPDANAQLDANAQPDANAQLISCGDPFDDTLSFYPVDSASATLEDTRGEADGAPTDVNSMPIGLKLVLDGPCGPALDFNDNAEDQKWHIEISSQSHQAMQLSVDFWIRVSAQSNLGDTGILTRDQYDNKPADFSIWQVQPVGESPTLIVRTQSATADQYTCSDPLTLDAWHHVAVAIGDRMETRLFVDGIRVDQTQRKLSLHDQEVTCEDIIFDSGINMTLNTQPWVLGASNAGAGISHHMTSGAIDNLRIRRGLFTQQDAAAIYNN